MRAPMPCRAPAVLAAVVLVTVVVAAGTPGAAEALSDPRSLFAGTTMVQTGYLDQPYCAAGVHPFYSTVGASADDDPWVCVVTDGAGHEGGAGEHMVSVTSTDQGKTWSKPVPIEPPPGQLELANSYAAVVRAPTSKRVFAIYNMNTQNVTHEPDGTKVARTDMIGKFVMRYSDDDGATWSATQYPVPFRLTAIDRNNTWNGTVTIMWNVDTIKVASNGTCYWSFTKINQYMLNPPEELWIMASDNLLTEADPSKISYRLLPDGDFGLQPPNGNPRIFEEGHVMPLPLKPATAAGVAGLAGAEPSAPGGFYVVGRTTQGILGAAHTADPTAASGWSTSDTARFWNSSLSPAGTFDPTDSAHCLRQPRGPLQMKGPLVHSGFGGGYLLLWYNNGYNDFNMGRNPYWLSSGVQSGSQILWSQPEVVLYDAESHNDRPGYPDMIETADGTILVTETQKTVARIHTVDSSLVALLFAQHNASAVAGDRLAATLKASDAGHSVAAPPVWPAFTGNGNVTVAQQGLSFDVVLKDHGGATAGSAILDGRLASSIGSDAVANGVALLVAAKGAVTLVIGDGTTNVSATMGPVCAGRLSAPGEHFLAVVADAGPNIVTFFVDGYLCDGGGVIDWGWFWIGPVGAPAGALQKAVLRVAPDYRGQFLGGHVYTRMLRTSEVVGNWRASTA